MSSDLESILLRNLPVLNGRIDRMSEQVDQARRDVAEIKARLTTLEIALCCTKKDDIPGDVPSIPVEDLFDQLRTGVENLDRKFNKIFSA